jgi:hypothetical protein
MLKRERKWFSEYVSFGGIFARMPLIMATCGEGAMSPRR